MNRTSNLEEWLGERNVEQVEFIVSDMAGIARGKMQPVAELTSKDMKLPIAIFTQTINSDFHMPKENIADRDMNLRPDVETLRIVPWATEPTASTIMDCYDMDGQLIEASPRAVLKRVAIAHGMRVTFLAKPSMDGPGSSMHIHQSVYDNGNENIFSDTDGEPSKLFESYLGGLQKHMTSVLLLFAPYANSYRRFLSYYSSPVNLEWGVDNRTVGLRVPRSEASARRVENRLAGSDVNPYLAIAGTLACGYLGMTHGLSPRSEVTGSAYEFPFALHRHLYEALDAFRDSSELRNILGDDFVTQYCAVKELEYRDFQRHISEWERDELMFSV